jgi:predicted transcriptional regulator
MNQFNVPSGALTVRLNPRQRARLQRLTNMLDATQAQTVNEALVHLLATLEMGQPVHRFVPSEQQAGERDQDKDDQR